MVDGTWRMYEEEKGWGDDSVERRSGREDAEDGGCNEERMEGDDDDDGDGDGDDGKSGVICSTHPHRLMDRA